MKILLFSIFIFSLSITDSSVPTFTFHVYETQIENVNDKISEGIFGVEVANLERIFESNYKIVDNEAGILSAGSSYTLRKPELYSIVGKIRRYYKKEIKRDSIKLEEYSRNYARVLTVANAIIVTDTNEFEMALKEAASAEIMSAIFSKAVLIYD